MVQTNVDFRVRYGAFRYGWILHIEFNSVSFSLSLLWSFNCNVRATTTKILKDQICRYSTGDDSRAANFDVNRWQSEWIFTRGERLDFECWVGRKSHCKGFILAEFSTYFSGAFPWKNGSITHPECTKTHCFEFEEAKLLWSFGLVRKAGVFIEFSWSFRGWDLEKTGFCFYKSFLFFGNYLYYIPENYIFVLKDSLDLSEFFIDNMMTSDVLHPIGPHHCRGCVVCDLRRFVDGDFCWKGL